jgi:hypothetical protein
VRLARARAGFRAGTVTAADVSEATIALARARIQSPDAQRPPNAIPDALQTVVTENEALLKMAEERYRAGASSAADLSRARTALAEARVSSALYGLAALRDQDLAMRRSLYRAGALSVDDLTKAEKADAEAHRRFDESQRGGAD